MLSAESRAILPEPPEELKQLSNELSGRIRGRIREHGPLPFSEFMEMALYEPGLGYYSAGLAKFGEEGDFVTAPELGEVFARCMAIQAREAADLLGSWDVLEIGAGSGRFAAAFLAALGAAGAPTRYRILERSADLRAVQRQSLERDVPELAARVEWLDTPPTDHWQGVLIANEVIDALAVERFCLQDETINQVLVDIESDGFTWGVAPAPPALGEAVTNLGKSLDDWPSSLPDGYRSEICIQLPAWLEAVTATLGCGIALFVDYGYPRSEYYRPERTDGTLINHFRHHGHDDPFNWPGLQDISAFVDFTALAEAGSQCGLDCVGYTSQAMFLIGCGLEQIMLELETLPTRQRLELSREIRMLMLPEAMGEKFQCMALARGFDHALRGFSQLDLRRRL